MEKLTVKIRFLDTHGKIEPVQVAAASQVFIYIHTDNLVATSFFIHFIQLNCCGI